MTPRRTWSWRGAVLGLAALAIGGCTLATDLLDPTLAASLGLPGTQSGDQGVVIMAFNNTTSFPAVFVGYKADNATDVTSGARNFSVETQPGEVANEIIECPVDALGPGTIAADLTVDPLAAVVITGTAAVDVTYGGAPLLSGDAFNCGDVVEIRLVSTTTGTGGQQQVALRIQVQVVPGR